MPDISRSLTFSLQKPVSADALLGLRADATRAVEAGAAAIAIDVDDVGILDSQVISTLIAILRDVRERGAAVELHASRKSILDTLQITALDKVFTVSESAPSASPRPAAPPRRAAVVRRGRLVASVAAGAFAAASLLGTHAATGSDSSPHAKPAGPQTGAPGDRR